MELKDEKRLAIRFCFHILYVWNKKRISNWVHEKKAETKTDMNEYIRETDI